MSTPMVRAFGNSINQRLADEARDRYRTAVAEARALTAEARQAHIDAWLASAVAFFEGRITREEMHAESQRIRALGLEEEARRQFAAARG